MYECHIKAFGETFDCKDKAQCLEMMVSSEVGFGLVMRFSQLNSDIIRYQVQIKLSLHLIKFVFSRELFTVRTELV